MPEDLFIQNMEGEDIQVPPEYKKYVLNSQVAKWLSLLVSVKQSNRQRFLRTFDLRKLFLFKD